MIYSPKMSVIKLIYRTLVWGRHADTFPRGTNMAAVRERPFVILFSHLSDKFSHYESAALI